MNLVNGLHCLSCNTVIFSRARHDFRRCKCKKIAVDGGFDYLKISFKEDATYRIVSVKLPTRLSKPALYKDWNTGTDRFGLIEKFSYIETSDDKYLVEEI